MKTIVDNLRQLQSSLGITFRDTALLRQALVHRSYLNEATPPEITPASNERLEFLGDAVLGLIVADELYHLFPDLPEGQLTEMRAHLVRGATLARVGERLELGSFLVLGRGEEQSGGRGRSVNLGRALEAVLGSIYLDRGLEAVRRVVLRLLAEEFDRLDAAGVDLDAKSTLQQLAQAALRVTPEYVTISEEGPNHEREFVVHVRLHEEIAGIGRGRNKRLAQQAAAAEALKALSITPPRQLDQPEALSVTQPSQSERPEAHPGASDGGTRPPAHASRRRRHG